MSPHKLDLLHSSQQYSSVQYPCRGPLAKCRDAVDGGYAHEMFSTHTAMLKTLLASLSWLAYTGRCSWCQAELQNVTLDAPSLRAMRQSFTEGQCTVPVCQNSAAQGFRSPYCMCCSKHPKEERRADSEGTRRLEVRQPHPTRTTLYCTVQCLNLLAVLYAKTWTVLICCTVLYSTRMQGLTQCESIPAVLSLLFVGIFPSLSEPWILLLKTTAWKRGALGEIRVCLGEIRVCQSLSSTGHGQCPSRPQDHTSAQFATYTSVSGRAKGFKKWETPLRLSAGIQQAYRRIPCAPSRHTWRSPVLCWGAGPLSSCMGSASSSLPLLRLPMSAQQQQPQQPPQQQ